MIIRKKTKKAYSLLEVLIVLIIISFTMVGAMNIIVNANISIKANEIRDYANYLALKALEVLKSSDDIFVESDGYSALALVGSSVYFSLKEDGSGKYLKLDVPPVTDIGTCSKSSEYYNPVLINAQDKAYLICLQIHIIPRNSASTLKKYYEVDMQVVYLLPTGPTTDSYKTYRYELFKAKP